MQIESIAAVDIGSNAIRLLISNIESHEKINCIKKNSYIRVPVRLGEDVFKQGRVGVEKIRRLIETMKAFTHLMYAFNVPHYYACATSAIREAENSVEVAEQVLKQTGLEIDIVDSLKEADLIFAANSYYQYMEQDKSYLHVDVGGGSTEIIVYCHQRKEASFSYPIGTLRILAGAVSPESASEFAETLRDIRDNYEPQAIIASGGNINKTLKLLGKKDENVLPFQAVEKFHKELSSLTFTERLEKYKMNSYRADVIVPALHIFLTIGRACKIDNYIIPKVGLVDGIMNQIHNGTLTPRTTPVPGYSCEHN